MTERNDEVAEAARRLQEGVARINEDFARLGHTQIHTTAALRDFFAGFMTNGTPWPRPSRRSGASESRSGAVKLS